MSIVDRVVKIRNDAGLNLTDFAKKLNVSRSLISLLEKGEREYTERTLQDICGKFNVNPDWLIYGKGEPYNETAVTTIKLLKSEYKLDDLDVKIIETYLALSPEERQVFKNYIKRLGSVD